MAEENKQAYLLTAVYLGFKLVSFWRKSLSKCNFQHLFAIYEQIRCLDFTVFFCAVTFQHVTSSR